MENNKHGRKKISLEELDKKNIYSVPEGYFDKLSYSIQDRIHQKENTWFEKLKISPVRYAIPALSIILGLVIYLFMKPTIEQVAIYKKPESKIGLKKKELEQEEKTTNITSHLNNTNKKIDDLKIAIPKNDESQIQENNRNIADHNTAETAKTAQQYLAGVSKEDIRTYLVMNDLDESQMEETVIEN